MKRSLRTILWGIVLGGILGSALSSLLSHVFVSGPLRDIFVKGIKIGIPDFKAMLGFFELIFGFTIHLTLISIIFIIIVTIILLKI